MARMVSFKLNRECREISVNPARVLYVCHYEHGAASIHFGKDCHVRVQGSVSDVSAKIEAALHDFETPTNPSQPPDEPKRAGVN